MVNNADPGAKPFGFLHVMRGIDDGLPLFVQGNKKIKNCIAGLRVNTDCWLIA